MSRVVVLGAGIAGHTAAAFARKWLGSEHTVTVVSPRPDYNWVPSNIWVGVGLMKPEQVTIPLAPVYERAGIEFVQAAAQRSTRTATVITRARTSWSSRPAARRRAALRLSDQRDRAGAAVRQD